MSLFPEKNNEIYNTITINLITFKRLSGMQLLRIEQKLANLFLELTPNITSCHRYEKGYKDIYFHNLFGILWEKYDLDNQNNKIYNIYSLFYNWTKENINKGECMASVIFQG